MTNTVILYINETFLERKTVSWRYGTRHLLVSFKMVNASLMDSDNILVLTDQSGDLRQSYVLPRKNNYLHL